jgi:hypothetical protein
MSIDSGSVNLLLILSACRAYRRLAREALDSASCRDIFSSYHPRYPLVA